ncbi:MAG: hypothetical protein JW892_06740 [Anaerolineae bacterium]|nr:hypothetical protein [Anaerolineae bacterium]
MARRRVFDVAGRILFALGILLGVALWGSMVWVDIEAFLFDSSLDADAALTSLRCPVLITAAEDGEIRATFSNSLDWAIKPKLTFHVTDGFVSLMREESGYLTLEPGEKRELAWQVSVEDAAWDYFILARVYLPRAHPLPSRTSSCGIVALDISFLTGSQMLAALILGTGLLLGVGFYLWTSAHRPLEGRWMQQARGRGAMMALVGLGIVFGVLGLWLPGLLSLIVLVLLIVVMLARAAMEAD